MINRRLSELFCNWLDILPLKQLPADATLEPIGRITLAFHIRQPHYISAISATCRIMTLLVGAQGQILLRLNASTQWSTLKLKKSCGQSGDLNSQKTWVQYPALPNFFHSPWILGESGKTENPPIIKLFGVSSDR